MELGVCIDDLDLSLDDLWEVNLEIMHVSGFVFRDILSMMEES